MIPKFFDLSSTAQSIRVRCYVFFHFYFLSLFYTTTFAQSNSESVFPVKNLSIHWETMQNDYQNRPVSLNAVTITNNSTIEFPGKGWKMYFNSARLITPATLTGNARIDLMNGDLFSLTPSDGFPTLKPGASVRIEFVAEEPVVNITDGPEGFYLVWDAMPGKGYSMGPFTIHPFKPNYKGLVTPAIIYDQNKIIRDIPAEQLTKIFPTPLSYLETAGYFDLKNNIRLVSDERFKKEKEGLITTLESLLGKNIIAETSGNTISLEYKDGLTSEGYELEVKTNSIVIRASASAGIFYGIQSLKTLIPPDAWAKPHKSIQIPAVIVKDEPRFGYRAFMLDVGRNFQPKKEVLKLLDLMALYKLNVFHFHLTEDEGWRLELPSLPELTEVGSHRGHTLDSKSFFTSFSWFWTRHQYGSGIWILYQGRLY